MKVIVVGASHAGIAAVQRIHQLYDDVELTVIDRRTENLSYIGAGAHMFLNGEVAGPEQTEYFEASQFEDLGVDLRLGTTVLAVDADAKSVMVRDLNSGATDELSYDRLIMATGSTPRLPATPGFDSTHIHVLKRLDDVVELKQVYDAMSQPNSQKRMIVIGGGMAGLEAAMAMSNAGMQVTVLHRGERLTTAYYDPEFSDQIADLFKQHNVDVVFNADVTELTELGPDAVRVSTTAGDFEAEEVLVTIGMLANSLLVADRVELSARRTIKVDPYQYSSDPNIMAIGDVASSYNPQTDQYWSVMHASGAIRQGILAATNLKEKRVEAPGNQGAYALKLYGQYFMRVGVTEADIRALHMPVKSVTYEGDMLAEYANMPKSDTRVTVKLVFNPETDVIYGVEIVSRYPLSEMINMIAIMINRGATVQDLAFSDMLFEPHMNTPMNFMSAVGLLAIDQK